MEISIKFFPKYFERLEKSKINDSMKQQLKNSPSGYIIVDYQNYEEISKNNPEAVGEIVAHLYYNKGNLLYKSMLETFDDVIENIFSDEPNYI